MRKEDRFKLAIQTKFRGATSTPYKPIVHPKTDKVAARKVLERLLSGSTSNEILSIKEISQR